MYVCMYVRVYIYIYIYNGIYEYRTVIIASVFAIIRARSTKAHLIKMIILGRDVGMALVKRWDASRASSRPSGDHDVGLSRGVLWLLDAKTSNGIVLRK